MQPIVLLKSSQSLYFGALAFGPQCSQNAVKQNLHEGKFFVVCVWEEGGAGWDLLGPLDFLDLPLLDFEQLKKVVYNLG